MVCLQGKRNKAGFEGNRREKGIWRGSHGPMLPESRCTRRRCNLHSWWRYRCTGSRTRSRLLWARSGAGSTHVEIRLGKKGIQGTMTEAQTSHANPYLFDSYTHDYDAPACSAPEKKTTFINRANRSVRHEFSALHERSTTFSLSVTGAFKSAFEAEMGYSAMNRASEEYRTTIEVPPRTVASLSASTSMLVHGGTWRHWLGWWQEKEVRTYRPTGHITWMYDEERY